jgi:hypothetical protein
MTGLAVLGPAWTLADAAATVKIASCAWSGEALNTSPTAAAAA